MAGVVFFIRHQRLIGATADQKRGSSHDKRKNSFHYSTLSMQHFGGEASGN
jgi:hypothetical protein